MSLQDTRSELDKVLGLFDLAGTVRDGLAASGVQSGEDMVQARRPKSTDNLLGLDLSGMPQSPMAAAAEKYGKGGLFFRNLLSRGGKGIWASALLPDVYGEGAQDKYKTEMALYKAGLTSQLEQQMAQQERDRMVGVNDAWHAAITNDDPTDDSRAYLAAINGGADAEALALAYASNPFFAASASGKPPEYYAGDLIYDEETNRYGQIMMDKHGGQSTTKWYDPGQIPKEAMMSRESFDASYNNALESRGTARSNLGQTNRAIEQISAVSDDDWTAGLAGDLETFWKTKITGGTDREQWAKKSAINVRNLQQMGMLPPGPATDRDVDLVMKGAPGDQASKKEWIEYLSAAQRLNEKAVYYQTERLNWMDERGLRGMQGFNKHWETIDPYKEAAAQPSEGMPPVPEGAGIDQAIWEAMTPEDRALWN